MSIAAEGSGVPPTRHASIQALLNEHPGETNPKKIIRRLAQQKVAQAKSLGWTGPPFCPAIFASLFGIRCKGVVHDIGGEGRILAHPDGRIVIEYREDSMFERRRFTMFHEFAHTLFPDFCEFRHPLNHAATRKLSDPEKEFENLCDIAAAEMLFPEEDFRQELSRSEPLGFETVHHLRQRYQASIDATTHRLVELVHSTPVTAVFLTDQKGEHSGSGPLWVKYSCKNPLFKGYIPPGVMPPPDSVAHTCFSNAHDSPITKRETWWINRQPRTWLAQAQKLPDVPAQPDYAKVVVLLFPSGYRRK